MRKGHERSRFSLGYQQFNALCRKNATLKLRHWLQLLIELAVPVLFMFSFDLIKEETKPVVINGDIPTNSYPVAGMEYLLEHTEYPNVLCSDNNIFYSCSCDDIVDKWWYYSWWRPGWDTYGSGYWQNMHSDQLKPCLKMGQFFTEQGDSILDFATALADKLSIDFLTDPDSICDLFKAVNDVCGSEQIDQILDDLNGEIDSELDIDLFELIDIDLFELCDIEDSESLAQAHSSTLVFLDLVNKFELGYTVEEDEIDSRCERQMMAIAPAEDSSELKAVVAAFEDYIVDRYPRLADFISVFDSEDEIDDYVTQNGYSQDNSITPKVGSGIVFHSTSPSWDYSVRLNFTKDSLDYREAIIPSTRDVTNPFLRRWQESPGQERGIYFRPYADMYMTSSFLALQLLVDEFIFEQENTDGTTLKPPTFKLANFPYESYETSDFWDSMAFLFAFMIVLSTMYPISNMIKSFVQEKELKLKEGMRMMGLNPMVHTLSWWAHFVMFFVAVNILVVLASRPLFEYSSPVLIFIYFMSFSLASISFAFLISAFFSRAKTAATIGVLFFFSSIFPYFAVEDAGGSTKTVSCLLPATCLALGTDSFVIFEDASIGVTFYTLNQSTGSSIPFSSVIVMLLVDAVLYGFLAWYFNQIVPSTWGTHRKPWFLFTKAYWLPSKASLDNISKHRDLLKEKEESIGNPNVEGVPDELKRQIDGGECIALRGLGKTYRSASAEKVAVDRLNLTIYQGQITALLGHNGAGKTTTISMLTGMTPITSGVAFVQGKDVGTELQTIRRNLGVCPQHDILYPTLTVKEHLTMYASFKGVPRKQVSQEVDKMIKEVGLTEKRNAFSRNLSGGQKRKLSVAIAFIGNSKIVFLDEPTSGMDPYSRRFTWDVIRRNREGRIIVLTTHFMDEADLLGDRIAIMGDGKLRCCGSSLFLKSRFGVGYNLTLVKKMRGRNGEDRFAEKDVLETKDDAPAFKNQDYHSLSLCNEEEVLDLVRSHIPTSELLSNVGAEMTFQLPQNASPSFPALLFELDKSLGALGVETYGISVTTLEEVFIRVAQGAFDQEVQEQIRRNSMSVSIAEVDKLNADLWKVDDAWKAERLNGFHLFLLHMKIMFYKRFLNYKRDRRSWLFTFISPSGFILLGMLVLQFSANWAKPALTLDAQEQYNRRASNPQNPVYYGYSCNGTEGMLCSDVEGLIGQLQGISPIYLSSENFQPGDTLTYSINDHLLATKEDYKASRYGTYWFEQSTDDETPFQATLHTNFTACHSVPTFINALNEAVLRFFSGDSAASITVRNHPLELTKHELSQKSGIDGFTVTIFLLFAFAFIPAGFAQFVVREKEMKIKYQQVVSGINLNAYWLSNWLWDFLQYMLGPMALTLILWAIFDVDILLGREAAPVTFVLMFLFGLAVIPFTYLTSFIFKSAAVAQNLTILCNWIFGLLLMCATFIMSLIDSTQDEAKVLRWFGRIFPQFCFADSMLRISFRDFLPIFDESLPINPSPWELEIAGYSLIFLAVEAALYGILVLLVERWSAGSSPIMQKLDNLRLQSRNYQPSRLDPKDIDEDVQQETERVMSGAAKDDVIQLRHLKKAFPLRMKGIKEAVKDVTLGVPRGECFGLLGINGAGKSTTLSILTGEQPPTNGCGVLAGMNVTTEAEEVHKLVGYCPQFDAIFPSLTGRENLQVYGRIKGIPVDKLDSLVGQTLKQMSLVPYADRIAGGYSGGNKRKLSVAIAMIGGPELMFLDEPSTGMDPVSRRYMWDVITKISTEWAQCAIILTTHSMEECEALCTRIGIMVGGRLRCLGSAQHLKSRFGMGFQLEMGLEPPSAKELSTTLSKMEASVLVLGGEESDKQNPSVNQEQLKAVLNSMGCDAERWMEKFHPQGSAMHLYHELHTTGFLSLKDLASWFCLEQRSLKAESFILSSFKSAVLRERQSAKIRFEYPPQNMTIGEMFQILEGEREALKVKEYSLSQTTLEQIFNFFASQQEEETGQAGGIVKLANSFRLGASKVKIHSESDSEEIVQSLTLKSI